MQTQDLKLDSQKSSSTGMAHENNPKITVTWQDTPNPATLRFAISAKIGDRSQDFLAAAETESSPLAAKIFGFPWTNAVFIGSDFLTVTKQDWVDWNVLAEPLTGLIQEHFNGGEPVWIEMPQASVDDANDSDLVKKIKLILKNEVKPVVALDGGDIDFVRFEEGTLFLLMKGSCAGCPSSAQTLKDGIETRIRELLPEVKEVVSVN